MPSLPASPAFSDVNGIEVREYYAAAAMQGLLANPHVMTMRIAKDTHRELVAAVAFLIADEMIAASAATIPVLRASVEAADIQRNA